MFHHAKQFPMRQEQHNSVDFIFWQFKKALATENALVRVGWYFHSIMNPHPLVWQQSALLIQQKVFEILMLMKASPSEK